MKLGEYLKKSPKTSRALVVQGGGMRAVYSMAALSVLNKEGLTNSFSLAIGSSAGAINASYFLTDMTDIGTRVYVDFLSNRQFINPLRVNRILDVEFLVEQVLRPHGVFTQEKLKSLETDLNAIVSHADTGAGRVFSNTDGANWYDVLHASAAMPYVYNQRVTIDGKEYIDGAIAEPLPVRHVIDRGYNEVVAVITRPLDYRSAERSSKEKLIIKALGRGVNSHVTESLLAPDHRLNDDLAILGGNATPPDVSTWTIAPSCSELMVGEVTSDRGRLKACAELAVEDASRMLEQAVPESVLGTF